MLDFITIPAVLAVIGIFTYRIFELFARKKERLMIIERAQDLKVSGITLPTFKASNNGQFIALRWGALILGIGLGLVIGFFICSNTMTFKQMSLWEGRELMSVVYGGCTLFCGGLGLVLAFITELKLKGQKND